MTEVKWIKIVTDIFDDEKMLLIESLPSADSLIVIWFKLLCLAGKNNNQGVFLLNDKIAYTDEMLATIFRRDVNTVRLALNTFKDFGMIEIIDGVITIPNWGKHQTLDRIEQKNEYMRGYMKEYREKQKKKIECKTNSKTNSKSNVSEADIERDKDIDKEYISCSEPNELASEPVAYIPLNDGSEYGVTEIMYNEFCSCYPSVDVKQELLKMRAWSLSNPTKKKTKRGVTKFINGWLSKEQDKGGTRKSSEGQINLEDWANEKE